MGPMRVRKKGMDLKWKRNVLRHSSISYRSAEKQNVRQVACRSPQTIISNYRKLGKPASAAKWFAMEPGMPANGISVPHATAIA